MKKYLTKRVLTTNLILVFAFMTHAQNLRPWEDPAFGADSTSRMECAASLSTMSEYMKIKLYDYAMPAWRFVYDNCPASSKNIYIDGVKIFREKVKSSQSPEEKTAYLDTLMMVYDKRIEYFGEEGYVQGRKGIDIIRLDEDAYDKAYEAFSRSVELSGSETDVNVVMGLVQTSLVMMKTGKTDLTDFLSDYTKARDLLETMKSEGASTLRIGRAQEMIDKTLSGAGIRDCEAIEQLFSEKIAAGEDDPSMLNLASELLVSSGCTNSEFYAEVNEKLLESSPDASRAYEVARYNIRNDNFAKAAEFLEKAIDIETDPGQKATYQYQLAVILSSRLGKYPEARDQAMLAIENKPGWGDPYFVIAASFVSGIGQCDVDDFGRKAVYWLAVDYCKKAKQMDPTCSQKANELISQYTSNFPSVEDTFFRSLKEGDTYNIECWINETTTVKTK